jgi:hypothetical protein
MGTAEMAAVFAETARRESVTLGPMTAERYIASLRDGREIWILPQRQQTPVARDWLADAGRAQRMPHHR